jgi:hypothetical protein
MTCCRQSARGEERHREGCVIHSHNRICIKWLKYVYPVKYPVLGLWANNPTLGAGVPRRVPLQPAGAAGSQAEHGGARSGQAPLRGAWGYV